MSKYKIIDMLKEINSYNITWDNAINFVLQNKGRSNDYSFFFYKSSLLQLLKCNKHLDIMLALYYKVEDSSLISNEISQIYKDFIEGNNEALINILKLAKSFEEELYKIVGFDNYNFYRSSTPKKIGNILNMIIELDCLVERKCIELENYKEEENPFVRERIKNNIKNINEKIEIKINKLEKIFKSCGSIILLEKMNFSEAKEDNLDWEIICERFALRFSNYYNFISLYHFLIEDLVFSSRVIKEYFKIVDMINKTKDLNQVCIFIRQILLPSKKQEFRKEKLVGDKFMKYTSKPENILADFNILAIEFKTILEEENIDTFIRKCADFHYDFLKVHPYNDGNGRTARILLSTMLLSKNIMLPTLYCNAYDKGIFYLNSDTALKGNYRNIEQELFLRLGHYYPIVIPKIKQLQK